MSRTRFESLDSLRAIACFLVIWQHVSETFRDKASSGIWASDLANYLDFGRIGVVSFFCISGFVIPNSLRGNRVEAVRDFAINRFFRLYPIYWLSIPPAILFVWTAWGQKVDASTLSSNLTMLPSLFGSIPIQGLYWTLEVELIFYFACALFYSIFGNLKTPALLVAFAVCYQLYRHNPLASTPGNFPILFYHLSIMFASASLRGVFDYAKRQKEDRSQILLFILSALVVWTGYLIASPAIAGLVKSFTLPDPVWSKYGYGYCLSFLLFIIFLVNQKTPSWLAQIGRYTYSAYLAHGVVLYAAEKIFIQSQLKNSTLIIYIIIITIFTIAIAVTTYKLVEAPSIRLGKTIVERLKNRRGEVLTT